MRRTDRIQNMTEGNPMRLLVFFAVPLLLGNLFQQLYSVVDGMVLGRGVGVDALAAAGASGSVHFFIFGFVNGLTHGYSILVAQRFGAGEARGVRAAVANAGFVAAASSAVIMAASLLLSRPLLRLMRTPDDLFENALLYLRILLVGIFATVFYNVLAAILRALGDSVSPLIVIVVSSALNVVLDLLFVMVFRWGVAGAAWATVLAQLVSGFICLAVLMRLPMMRFEKGDARPDLRTMGELLRLGVPVGLMNSVTAVGGMVLQGGVNTLGSKAVAAYTAVGRIFSLAEQPGVIVGLSLGTFVGQNRGARRFDRVRLGVRRAILLTVLVNAAVGAALIFFGRGMIAAFVSPEETEVIGIAYPFLVTAGFAEWVLGLLFIYRNALQNLGDTFVPMLSGGLELLLRVSLLWLFTGAVADIGFSALIVAEIGAWVGAAVMLCIAYYVRAAHFGKDLEGK